MLKSQQLILRLVVLALSANAQREHLDGAKSLVIVKGPYHESSFSLPSGWRPLEPDLRTFAFTNAKATERLKGIIIPKGRCMLTGGLSKVQNSLDVWMKQQLQLSFSERGAQPPVPREAPLLPNMRNVRIYRFEKTWEFDGLHSIHWLFEVGAVRHHLRLVSYLGLGHECESASNLIIQAYLESNMKASGTH